MNRRRMVVRLVFAVAALPGVATLGGRPVAAQSTLPAGSVALSGAPTDKNLEILTRGPVHEAFAQPIVFDPQPGVVVPKQPPDPVNEVAPDEQPEGDNVSWIPGYWSWDTDRQRFIWVSGIWRAIPAGLEWIPGYWTQSGSGYQWISGFWRRADPTEIAYLPKPPDSLEDGPVGDPPSENHIWVPGCWQYTNQYAWRPGFWAQCQPGWIWVPAYYVWTPSGYVYVDGYWDYDLSRRGVLFSPVAFRNRFIPGPNYYYTPSVVLDADVLTEYLFCRPRFHCYCFGDYYAANYIQEGIFPWFSYHMSHYGYDPIYAYYSWDHRNDHRWHERLVSDYRYRREHVEARPPLTYAAMRTFVRRPGVRPFAIPWHTLVDRRGGAFHFQRVTAARREEIRRSLVDSREFRERRHQIETKVHERLPGKDGEHEPIRKMEISKGRLEKRPKPNRPLTREHIPPVRPHHPAAIHNKEFKPAKVVRPHPRERLSNPHYVPHPSNKGAPHVEHKRN